MSELNKKRKMPKHISKERFKSKIVENGRKLGFKDKEKIRDALEFEINFIKNSDLSAEDKLRRIDDLLVGEEDVSDTMESLGCEFKIEKDGRECHFEVLYQVKDNGDLVLVLAPKFKKENKEDNKTRKELIDRALGKKN